ncbi:MAG: PEGA domain-containing protein [Acidobacteriota bacterium]
MARWSSAIWLETRLSCQIQYDKLQLILTLDLQHNRVSGLHLAENSAQCFDVGNIFAIEGDYQISRRETFPSCRQSRHARGHQNAGELKLKTNVKDADVYINGAYAGKAAKLKSMWLQPDAYNIEIRAAGYTSCAERIYLLAGKSWQVKADLVPVPKS